MHESDRMQLLQVIGNFLEMGHVENIVAMFKQNSSLYSLTGYLLRDERFQEEAPPLRGEAATLLGTSFSPPLRG